MRNSQRTITSTWPLEHNTRKATGSLSLSLLQLSLPKREDCKTRTDTSTVKQNKDLHVKLNPYRQREQQRTINKQRQNLLERIAAETTCEGVKKNTEKSSPYILLL